MSEKNSKETLSVELDAELLHEAEEILSYLSLTTEEAVRLFFNQIILTGGLPFKLRLPRDLRTAALAHPLTSKKAEPETVQVETTLPEFLSSHRDVIEEEEETVTAQSDSFPVSEEHESHADAFMQSILDEVYDEIRRGES